MQNTIETHVVLPGSSDVAQIATWRHAAFSDVLANTLEQEVAALESFVRNSERQCALIATRNGQAAGTCLLVPDELQPCHPVTPWLAGLYVAPEHRRRGVGRVLVAAIEAQAKLSGFARVHLYTNGAAPYYQRLGWSVLDRVDWKGLPMALMVRDL